MEIGLGRLHIGRMAMLGAVMIGGFLGAPSCDDSESTVDEVPPGGDSCERNGEACDVVCDPTLGCVDCLTNDDCGAAQPICVAGGCEECGDNDDCGTAQACFPRDHECNPACQDAGDCNGDAPICDPVTTACVGCIDANDCDNEQPICSDVTKQCVECAHHEDCGAAQPYCDAGNCRQCLVDAHCGAGELCRDHECEPGCLSNDDCGDERPICNLDNNSCVECIDGNDCPAAAPVCANNHRCVGCQVNEDCTDPVLKVCRDDECVECDGDEDCDPGFQCSGQMCEPN